MSQEALLPVDAASLPDDPQFLKRLVTQLVETVRDRDGRIQRLEHNMDLLLRRLYGRSSEKLDPRQGVLFENLSVEESPPVAPLAEPAPSDRPVDSSPRRGHGRRRTEKNLRHVDIVHDLTEAEKEALGGEVRLVLIGEEITEQYEWEPSCLYVIRHIQRKYVRRPQPVGTHAIQPSEHLEGENTAEHKHATAQPIVVEEPSTQDLEEPAVIVAPKPPQPIPGGLAGPGLLAQLLVSKYADHLPLHRFERISQRHGVRFSRQTTCDWSLACADLLGPLDELSRDEVLASAVVHTDDTPVDVRNAHRKEQYTARFWDYVGDDGHRLVWFDYTPSRKRDGPARILKDFEGYLQADAFSGYDGIFVQSRGKIREVACWAHSRRKFKDAQNTDVARGQIALARIGQLYAIERELRERCQAEWKDLLAEERYARIAAERQSRATPLLETFQAWLTTEAGKLLPKEPMRQAIDYALSNWAALCRYTEAGFLDIDNNEAERALRGIALGRRNWLFCGSDRGGRAAAVHFGLIASCHRNGVDPFAYLRDVLRRLPLMLPHASRDELRALLPDHWAPR
ncbi:MAG: IS66 family transposase [Acidobacteriaceae bacterium]